MYQNILFGINTDMKNEKVLEQIAKLTGEGSEVTIVNVVSEKDMQASVRTGVHFDEIKERRQESMKHVFNYFNEQNIKYKLDFVKGNPKSTLVNKANSGDFDIVVLSNRKAEDEDKIVLGSVSHKVAKRAKIPVLIVK
ncbi:universal stress protein [Mammaliicoccus stepanovicii]|uniref:Universal stress protein n=1 Tax=Mammaliicoccus stepanovicii TaxID=643214 RepID=A0A239ZVB5_9STAP|nr:universal stress protein [Mammaliicoccus stepanovicii]PNZ77427.1 universal stress protein [Mammaliicoccus stepanovicii]GGI39049.1 universal stress protein UspA [Mammaliicoccus stepanovicii]SNV75025.1 universal stress protein [Mammaliicoccus stepanovicii]